MPLRLLAGILAMVVLSTNAATDAAADGVDADTRGVVIAHRGASGYLPEHTLASKAMAYAMGADFLEQDVVMTRDDQLMVMHDITLDRTTDVAYRFPGRSREDGLHYVVDFTLAEIQSLEVTEGARQVGDSRQAIYPGRFPVGLSTFRIHTLAQEIELIQGLNHSTGADVGIYPEIKSPAFFHAEGKDLGSAVIAVLRNYGYTTRSDKVFVQTFDFEELKRLRHEVLPALGVDLKLVQLLDGGAENAWMQTAEGIREIARHADGLGPEKGMIIAYNAPFHDLRISDLVSHAHAQGLQVHPYTFRLDEGQVPPYARDFDHLLALFYEQAGVDGVFTDFPDRAVRYLHRR